MHYSSLNISSKQTSQVLWDCFTVGYAYELSLYDMYMYLESLYDMYMYLEWMRYIFTIITVYVLLPFMNALEFLNMASAITNRYDWVSSLIDAWIRQLGNDYESRISHGMNITLIFIR